MLYSDNHFNVLEDLKFQIMSINLPYFDKWLNPESYPIIVNSED